MGSPVRLSANRCFNGVQYVYSHESSATNCTMKFGVYVPDHGEGEKLPALVYLSGLTCTHANVMEKGGAQRWASHYKMIFIHPDTSPRGDDVPNDERYHLGQGAGFYVDATQDPWKKYFRMASYVEKELLSVASSIFPSLDSTRVGITGHSMGGHGAIVLGLRFPSIFSSISAFAPIAHPMDSQWGRLALTTYLGGEEKEWAAYDSLSLLSSYSGPSRSILISQGDEDEFFVSGQLKSNLLKSTGPVEVEVRVEGGFDHSYYFVNTFMEEHFKHHSAILSK